jgi:hypothetical protein
MRILMTLIAAVLIGAAGAYFGGCTDNDVTETVQQDVADVTETVQQDVADVTETVQQDVADVTETVQQDAQAEE